MIFTVRMHISDHNNKELCLLKLTVLQKSNSYVIVPIALWIMVVEKCNQLVASSFDVLYSGLT